MTKQEEWFRNFEGRLNALPPAERQRALDYYRELYSDKSDAGMSEKDIIDDFGSSDVAAQEIIENYRAADGTEKTERAEEFYGNPAPTPTQNYPNKTKKSDNKILATVLAVLVACVVGYWAFVATVVLCAVELALIGAGIGMSCVPNTLAVGLMCLGIAVILLAPVILAIRGMIKGVVSLTKKTYNGIIGREEK